MASFYSRPNYTPTWNQRIFPVQEPNFDQPVASGPSSPATPASTLARRSSSPPRSPGLARTTRPRSLRIVEPASAPQSPVREAPPPVYYPGARRRSEVSSGQELAPGLAPSTNTASTASCTVQWAYHPCAPEAQGERGRWGKWLRIGEIRRALAGQKEVLWDGWPRQFGGRERVPWELTQRDSAGPAADQEEGGAAATVGGDRRSRSLSLSLARSLSHRTTRTTAADSGIALSPHPTHEPAHPLAPLYKKRIAELNDLIQDNLVIARIWLALVELLDYIWIVALVVALAQGGGKQTGFVKGVEIGLVLVILLNGLSVNAVRMRRYTLACALKARTRDWSPLALTSSNAQLMRNYLDGDAELGRTDSMAPKDGAVMRWRMRETEGSFWLGYRPIIRVELVTPSSFSSTAYLPVVDPQLGAPPPVTGPSDTSLILELPLANNGAAGGATANGVSEQAGEPPRYEEAR